MIQINKRFLFLLTASKLIQSAVQNVDCYVLCLITTHQHEHGDVKASRGRANRIALHKLLYYALTALPERAYYYFIAFAIEWVILHFKGIRLDIKNKGNILLLIFTYVYYELKALCQLLHRSVLSSIPFPPILTTQISTPFQTKVKNGGVIRLVSHMH
jgi:hypothetical protein